MFDPRRDVPAKCYARAFTPEDGMNVIVTGSVQVYERDGVYQLYCETMQPDGIGELYLAFEQRKEKLQKEGLFDPAHKTSAAALSTKNRVVTSKTGAAFQDILNILKRRYPIATVVLFPALVQGEEAPASITAGIRAAGKYPGIDVLIVGRGGGSMRIYGLLMTKPWRGPLMTHLFRSFQQSDMNRFYDFGLCGRSARADAIRQPRNCAHRTGKICCLNWRARRNGLISF